MVGFGGGGGKSDRGTGRTDAKQGQEQGQVVLPCARMYRHGGVIGVVYGGGAVGTRRWFLGLSGSRMVTET